MRVVACCTVSGNHRGVFALYLLDFFARVGAVARVTEKPLSCYDHPRDVASVGIMTFEALAVFEKLVVRPHHDQRHKVTVAFGAQLRVISSDQEQVFLIRPVGLVAAVTLTLDQRLVGICPGKFSFSINVAFVADHVHSVS